MKKQSHNSKIITSPPRVVIAGGGWAGIAAAIRLAQERIPTLLLEAEKQLGGRARCTRFGNLRVDNGQHIMLGYYHYLLALAAKIDLADDAFVVRKNFNLNVIAAKRKGYHIRAKRVFAPWHLALGILSAKGLSWKERSRLSAFWHRVSASTDENFDGVTLQELLYETKQPPELIKRFWQHLCQTFLHTPVENASAKIFIQLAKTMTQQRSNSQMLFPKGDLASLIGEPAIDYIESHKGKISLNQTITRLTIEDGLAKGVATETKDIRCEQVILALPYKTCASLFMEHPALTDVSNKLEKLHSSPMTTVYLQYPSKVSISAGIKGLADGVFDRFFDRRFCGQPNLIAAVSHGNKQLANMSNDEIARICVAETARVFPHWPKPTNLLTISEPEANLCCTVESENNRPPNCTEIPNCYIAGDYTDTGLPGTLESAVKSGIQCAEKVIQSLRR